LLFLGISQILRLHWHLPSRRSGRLFCCRCLRNRSNIYFSNLSLGLRYIRRALNRVSSWVRCVGQVGALIHAVCRGWLLRLNRNLTFRSISTGIQNMALLSGCLSCLSSLDLSFSFLYLAFSILLHLLKLSHLSLLLKLLLGSLLLAHKVLLLSQLLSHKLLLLSLSHLGHWVGSVGINSSLNVNINAVFYNGCELLINEFFVGLELKDLLNLLRA